MQTAHCFQCPNPSSGCFGRGSANIEVTYVSAPISTVVVSTGLVQASKAISATPNYDSEGSSLSSSSKSDNAQESETELEPEPRTRA